MLLQNPRRAYLRDFVVRQLTNLYGISDCDLSYIDKHLEQSICQTLFCFSHIKNKYFTSNDINVLHSGQYFIFLYYLANTIFSNEIKNGVCDVNIAINARCVCDKLYCLNKLLTSCEVYYEVELPEYFLVDHPLSSVIGRASIGNGFAFIQGCTVGGNNGVYPVIGENVFMYSNSKILGKSHIGNNVLIGANAYIKDMDIPDNVIVFGQYPNIIIKNNHYETIRQKSRNNSIYDRLFDVLKE